MNLFGILIAMPLIGLAYFVYVIVRRGEARLSRSVTPLPFAHPEAMRMTGNRAPKRKVKWISDKECEQLLRSSSDIVFLDMRSESKAPIPFAVPEVLVLNPSQIFDMLRWLPSSTSVVLYGASNLCTSVAWSARNICGWAPIYVLDPGSTIVGVGMKCSA
jgi:hypothetical protein